MGRGINWLTHYFGNTLPAPPTPSASPETPEDKLGGRGYVGFLQEGAPRPFSRVQAQARRELAVSGGKGSRTARQERQERTSRGAAQHRLQSARGTAQHPPPRKPCCSEWDLNTAFPRASHPRAPPRHARPPALAERSPPVPEAAARSLAARRHSGTRSEATRGRPRPPAPLARCTREGRANNPGRPRPPPARLRGSAGPPVLSTTRGLVRQPGQGHFEFSRGRGLGREGRQRTNTTNNRQGEEGRSEKQAFALGPQARPGGPEPGARAWARAGRGASTPPLPAPLPGATQSPTPPLRARAGAFLTARSLSALKARRGRGAAGAG